MSEYDKNDPRWIPVCEAWGTIERELTSLEGKTDPISNARRADLIEELMLVDMALKPVRKAMLDGAKGEGKNESGTP